MAATTLSVSDGLDDLKQRSPGHTDPATTGFAAPVTNDPDNAVASAYRYDLERARIREEIRVIVDKISGLWKSSPLATPALEELGEIDKLLKYKTLSSFRRRAFVGHAFGFMFFLVFLALIAIGGVFWGLNNGSITTDLVQGLLTSSATNVAIGSVLILVAINFWMRLNEIDSAKLDKQMSDYDSAISTRAARIDTEITQFLNQASADVALSRAKLKNVVESVQAADSVRQGIVETMRNWRKLERLPYYLRHEWDIYYRDIGDERELPRFQTKRILSAVAFIASVMLSSIAAGAAFIDVFLLDSAVAKAVGNENIDAFLAAGSIVFFAIFFVYNNIKRGLELSTRFNPTRLLMLLASLALCGLLFVCLGEGETMAEFARCVTIVAAAGMSVVGMFGLWFAFKLGRTYKLSADKAAVRITMALQTHQKDYLLDLLNMSHQRYQSLMIDPPSELDHWNGWTPDYRERRQAELAETMRKGEGDDAQPDHERIAWEIESDSLLYVGEDNNRRIQVSRYDPTIVFVQAFPNIRIN